MAAGAGAALPMGTGLVVSQQSTLVSELGMEMGHRGAGGGAEHPVKPIPGPAAGDVPTEPATR